MSAKAKGEFDRLREIFARLGPRAGELGDDCALVPLGGTTLALSIDCSVEGVHFRTDWLTFEEIGWRSAAGPLSERAAAGAEPGGVLLSLRMPGGAGHRRGLIERVGSAAQPVGAKVRRG